MWTSIIVSYKKRHNLFDIKKNAIQISSFQKNITYFIFTPLKISLFLRDENEILIIIIIIIMIKSVLWIGPQANLKKNWI